MSLDPTELMRSTLAKVAPGTELRDGIERIIRGRTGALVVLGHDEVVESIASGGFPLDIAFSATRLRELAKMDGAVIIDPESNRITRAATQLVPDASIETSESGTRHRTAERVSKQTGFPVVSVSQSMQLAAVYVSGARHVLEGSAAIISKANQAVQTLERYKNRFDEVAGSLSALEVEDMVTVRDVAMVLQRVEMLGRIAAEISGYVNELGTDGRLLTLQLEEMSAGMDRERDNVVRDYIAEETDRDVDSVMAEMSILNATELLNLSNAAAALGYSGLPERLDDPVRPRGYRMLYKIPRIPRLITDRLVEHFGALQPMLSATVDDLQAVDGIGEARARTVREGLSRLTESSVLERYV
ncbi:DNA integrity scanning protein DisA [Dermatophilus congolensis]|uniref:DNA integrity scanning protein DisA n=2 Tax=Dermatophilus congolensis TaxID=1863 RepID=A0A239VAT8_9MICO|nr:DNA integrity scanning protein DisA [Dermatophilus congolensis]